MIIRYLFTGTSNKISFSPLDQFIETESTTDELGTPKVIIFSDCDRYEEPALTLR